MRAPGFWQRPPGIPAHLLRPLASLYGKIAARRLTAAGWNAAMPVICIGNVTLGGAGKTPTAIRVAEIMRDAGYSPAFLSRGYGGRARGPVLVDPSVHSVSDVGDEALLLARHAPTIVARDRPGGAELAPSLGADLIILDDGLQNPSLRKDFTLGVFDGESGIGNGLTFPAGPLRAPLAVQWPLIGAVLIVGRGAAGEAIAVEAQVRARPVFRVALVPDPVRAAELRGQRVLAFGGIGRPEKFFQTLRLCGAELVQTRSFADHNAYTLADVRRLLADAVPSQLRLVTTEKDQVRLAALQEAEPRLRGVLALPVRLEIAEAAAFRDLLLKSLRREA